MINASHKIMKKETEEKETEATEESEMTDEKVSPAEQKEWKAKILAIDNRKLLDYICTLSDARRSIGRADHEVSNKDKRGKDGYPSYNPPPSKMQPVFPVESENIDEN